MFPRIDTCSLSEGFYLVFIVVPKYLLLLLALLILGVFVDTIAYPVRKLGLFKNFFQRVDAFWAVQEMKLKKHGLFTITNQVDLPQEVHAEIFSEYRQVETMEVLIQSGDLGHVVISATKPTMRVLQEGSFFSDRVVIRLDTNYLPAVEAMEMTTKRAIIKHLGLQGYLVREIFVPTTGKFYTTKELYGYACRFRAISAVETRLKPAGIH